MLKKSKLVWDFDNSCPQFAEGTTSPECWTIKLAWIGQLMGEVYQMNKIKKWDNFTQFRYFLQISKFSKYSYQWLETRGYSIGWKIVRMVSFDIDGGEGGIWTRDAPCEAWRFSRPFHSTTLALLHTIDFIIKNILCNRFIQIVFNYFIFYW